MKGDTAVFKKEWMMRYIPRDRRSNSPIIVENTASFTIIGYETTKLVMFFHRSRELNFQTELLLPFFGIRGLKG